MSGIEENELTNELTNSLEEDDFDHLRKNGRSRLPSLVFKNKSTLVNSKEQKRVRGIMSFD